jgi:hypothetical protein
VISTHTKVQKELLWNDLFHSFPKYFVVVLGKGSAKIMPGLRLFRADAACYSATCSILAKKTLRHLSFWWFDIFFWFSLPGAMTPQKTSDLSIDPSKVPLGPLEWRWYGLPAGHVSACGSQRYLAGWFGRPFCKSQVTQVNCWTGLLLFLNK